MKPGLAQAIFRPAQFTGWHMLGITVLFFGVIFAVNFYMAASALTTWTGLVVENSYVASQEFNTRQATAKAQAAMGWHGGLDYADGELVFWLKDGDEQPIAANAVDIEISRPVGIKGDRTMELHESPDGTYRTEISLDKGVWNATIAAHFDDGPDYEHHARLLVGIEQ